FCYGSASFLFWRDKVLLSTEGVHQGDPLSGLFFCSGLLPVLVELAATGIDFLSFFLDDGYIAGLAARVKEALELLKVLCGPLNLRVSDRKSSAMRTRATPDDMDIDESQPDR